MQIKRFKNVLENKKLIIEKNASDLTKFGTSLEGRTLSIISNETTLKKYADGTLDKQTTNDVNARVTSYISQKALYDEPITEDQHYTFGIGDIVKNKNPSCPHKA